MVRGRFCAAAYRVLALVGSDNVDSGGGFFLDLSVVVVGLV